MPFKRRSRHEGGVNPGRWGIPCLLVVLAACPLLASCGGGQTAAVGDLEEEAGQEQPIAEQEQPVEMDASCPSVDWYGYSYTFIEAWRDRDLNPQSEVIDYGGDYVHLRVRISCSGTEHAGVKAPLQVLLNCRGREYRIFGKDYTSKSYLWRDYTDFPDSPGESHNYIVTMELYPYSRALNSSFSMEEAELVLNGMDWANLEQLQITPLARFPLVQFEKEDTALP